MTAGRSTGGLARWGLPVLVMAGVLAACDDAIEPRAVMEIRIVPDSAHLAPGETAEFEPRPLNRNGVEMPHRRPDVEWSVTSSIGEITAVDEMGHARVTATEQGTGQLTATVLLQGGSIPIYVHPPGLDRIAIEPDPVITSNGATVSPRAVLLDAAGEELSTAGFRISWQTADNTTARIPLAFIDGPTTRVTGMTQQGETLLRLIVNGRVVTAPVIVRPEGSEP